MVDDLRTIPFLPVHLGNTDSNYFTSAVYSLELALQTLCIFPRLRHLQVDASMPVITSVNFHVYTSACLGQFWMCTDEAKKIKQILWHEEMPHIAS